MIRHLMLALLLAAPAAALAQTGSPPPAPANPMPLPFQRAGDPFILPATTTPQQYLVSQPAGTHAYRFVSPCMNADVRIKTVKPSTPMVTQPVVVNGQTVPGVLQITSPVDAPVTQFTGTLFLARSPEVLGSTQNVMVGDGRAISVMIVPIPGWPGTSPDLTNQMCPVNLGYGNGSNG